ncbi:uncharacterized protein LOC6569302 [Drosophila grimshawi]|uniref:GH17688 n=1 Tax=Drosophila grimshawi TaxID=7222 RepID=B4JWU6_DROGR|nr:uncharacterized protein LOC6569302 [Drosophila grimshawi]EDV95222.1 GH17688 [Drosophila grimshawi]
MPVKSVLIEFRPNLCCGQICLQFDEPIRNCKNTRLIINNGDMFFLENGNSEFVLRHDSWDMDITQLSLFNASGCHITFRFNYTKIDLIKLFKIGSGPKVSHLMPLELSFVEKKDHLTLHCNKCLYELAPGCNYNRLRELPSGLFDASEFFCHSHGTSGQEQPTSSVLVPRATQIYYGLNYIVLNMCVVQNRISNISGNLYCKRCMRMLGSSIESGAAAKLWADALRWLPLSSLNANGNDRASALTRLLFKHATVTHLMIRLLSSLWPLAGTQFSPHGKRAILTTTMPDGHDHYMLIQVRETQLAILRRIPNDEYLDKGCFHRACKLYFRDYGSCHFDRQWLEQWMQQQEQQQQYVPKLSISPYLYAELLKRFDDNMSLIPKRLRYNNFEEKLQFTYFFYESDEQELLHRQQQHQPCSMKPMPQPKLGEYETDAGLVASLDEEDADNESDDEHSDSELGSMLLHKSAPIMVYEKNLAKRWPHQK